MLRMRNTSSAPPQGWIATPPLVKKAARTWAFRELCRIVKTDNPQWTDEAVRLQVEHQNAERCLGIGASNFVVTDNSNLVFSSTLPATPKKQSPIWMILGAYGDICAVLPVFYQQYLYAGAQQAVIVAKKYADIFEGTSYVNPILFEGHYSDLPKAIAQWAPRYAKRLCPVQVYGDPGPHLGKSYVNDMWRKAGAGDRAARFPLVFDRREREREQYLWSTHMGKGPIVLFVGDGFSSPFPDKDRLLSVLQSELAGQCHIVDLSSVRCQRIFDLLGLFESAAILVTVDTAPLHLSRAAGIPVISLHPGDASTWTASPAYPNNVLRLYYSEWEKRKDEILTTIRTHLQPNRSRMVHVWNEYERTNAGAIKRNNVAKLSWSIAGGKVGMYVPLAIRDSDFYRNAHTALGDSKAVPYVRDLIEFGLASCFADDVLLVTNDDTVLMPDALPKIAEGVRKYGSIWGARSEFRRLDSPPSMTSLAGSYKHVGADLFAFTRGWWEKNGREFPDMVLAFENWDYIMRGIINMTGGKELFYLAAHECHPSYWLQNRNSPASIHNRNLSHGWLNTHKMPLI